MTPNRSVKTTAIEEWSYILLVLRELVSMGFSTVYDVFCGKCGKKEH